MSSDKPAPIKLFTRLDFEFFIYLCLGTGLLFVGGVWGAHHLYLLDSGSLLRPAIFVFLAFFAYSILLFVYVHRWLETRLFQPMRKLTENSSLGEQEVTQGVQALQEYIDRLEELQGTFEEGRRFSKVAVQTAHDVRSPLMALKVLASKNKDLPEELGSLMLATSERITDILNDLLKEYRAHYEQEAFKQYSLEKLALEIIREKQLEFASSEKIRITWDSNFGAGNDTVFVQGGHLARIISNLINNSIESFEGGAGEVRVSLLSGEVPTLSIRDDGCGISPEEIAEIEKGIYRTTKPGGHGLGLSSARDRMKSWKAQLEVRSASPGRGTLIILRFPKVNT